MADPTLPAPPGEVVIVGAGPAGIAAALALGRDAVVLEQRADIGGLTGSFDIQGAVFDYGGHSFHTPHADVRALVFGAVEMFEQKREARCYSDGALIPYPFQQHFRELPNATIVADCERGLYDADAARPAARLDDYLRGRFGPGIAEHFLLPYNRKLWGADLTRLSADWVGERIAAPAGGVERSDLAGGTRTPLQSTTTVAYPASGGFGQIAHALVRKVPDVRFGAKTVRIHPSRRTLVTQSGDVFQWTRLISTLPLTELVATIDEMPAAVKAAAGRLEWLSLQLVCAVVARPVATEIQRIYAADADMVAHKIVLNHNSSPSLRGLAHHGVMGEIAHAPGESLPPPDLERRFVKNLVTLNLIRDADEVIDVQVRRVRYAYPVPTLGAPNVVRQLKEWLEPRGIYSVGRFGEWAYINSDEALHRGLALGRALRLGAA